MGQQFCTVCGAKITEGTRFCESCGTPVEPAPVPIPASSPGVTTPASGAGPVSSPPPVGGAGKFPLKIVAGIVLILIIAAAAVVILLPKLNDGSLQGLPGQTTTVPTTIPTPVATPSAIATTTVPTPAPDPFPDAYPLRGIFSFNEGKYASKATVYRYWMNETYQWHNDMDNRYYMQRPKAGNKYLLIFVNIENIGSDGYPYPKTNMIVVHNGGNIYRVDTSHYLPNKAGDRKATPVEIQEIEQQSDFFNLERVEDYGYSHGTTQDFVFPGQGNAVDGYVIYEVPSSFKPENSYVEIVFDGQDKAVWKLA
jgi:hypothetical protein